MKAKDLLVDLFNLASLPSVERQKAVRLKLKSAFGLGVSGFWHKVIYIYPLDLVRLE